MREPTSVDKQYQEAAGDDVRVLVVGAGIAGITAAQLLRRDSRHPVVVEQAASRADPGYMLAMMPMVDPVLDALGVRDRYRSASVLIERYGLHTHTGRRARTDPIGHILARHGEYRGIARGALIDVLSADGCAVAFQSTVTAIEQGPNGAQVHLSTPDGPAEFEFDLVLVADGLHSTTRGLIPGGEPVQIVDTGWGGWVVWASEPPQGGEPNLGEEIQEVWGAGFCVGVYPVRDLLGVFLGGPYAATAVGPAAFVAEVRRKLTTVSPRLDCVLTAAADAAEPYYWSLTDCRAPAWTTPRTVLLGDAAGGFLPTAGMGAGMAMESAWLLARLLCHADRDGLAGVLTSYESAQRPRVEAAQRNSRLLVKLAFRRSLLFAVVRDLAVRLVSVESALKPIQRLLREQPDPEALAAGLATQR